MEGTKSVVIDTNLLVRYLTNDEPRKAQAVDDLLERAKKGETKIHIPSIVIAELAWVLESFYSIDSERIADLIEAILNTSGVDVTEGQIIRSALRLYRQKNIDLIDAWMSRVCKE